jgi:hypothetical protein
MLKDFAQDLKSLRESQNITIAEISAQTRINAKFLNLMESGVFDFQPETYIRSFLKEYAKCIGESENAVLTDYEKAKSGFYVRKTGAGSLKKDEPTISIKPVMDTPFLQGELPEKKAEVPAPKEGKEEWPPPEIKKKELYNDNGKEFSNKTLTQKILLGLLIVVIIGGIIYLIDYLNKSGDNGNSDVKPKSFSEISEDYETKIKGKKPDTNEVKQDSVANIVNDSLILKIVTFKDVRIKVYVDEKRIIEDIIPAKDSMIISAKEQFLFSASANASIDLYLNGEKLKKPSSLSGSTSIKNLVINKEGIVDE